MAEETVEAASSAVQLDAVPPQYDGWNEDGEPIVREKKPAEQPKSAEAASAETTDDEAGSAAQGKQEHGRRRPDVEERFRKLTGERDQIKAERDALQRQLEEARKTKEPKETQSGESSPARQIEPEYTRPMPKANDIGPDGKPKYSSYEKWIEDLSGWHVEQRAAALEREGALQRMRDKVQADLTAARERYSDYDAVARPLQVELMKPDISTSVSSVLNESPVLADLLYTLGGTEATRNDFLDACRHNPSKALRVALLAEQEIVRELAKSQPATKTAPASHDPVETMKPRAPKPPTEIGGRGASGEDALVEAAKSGDYRVFEQEQRRRVLASRR